MIFDQTGHPVSLNGTPQRIVSLVPSQTELLFQLGLEQATVGITRFCIHPENWHRTKTRVGGTKQVDFEKIRSLQPDLIIGNKEENTREDIDALRESYPVWLSDIVTVSDALEMIREVGNLTGKAPEAEMLAASLQESYSGLIASTAAFRPLRFAYLIWNDPYMAAGAGTFIHSMLSACGWINCFGQQDRYPVVTMEGIEALEPDVILLSTEPFPFTEKHRLDCARHFPDRKVLLVDGELCSWYGPRMMSGFHYLHTLAENLASHRSDAGR